jgi:hypothetical protein
MRRCCFFFLAFIAAVFLAVATGSFKNHRDIKNETVATAQTAIAAQEKDELTERSPLEIEEPGLSQKSMP